MIHIVGAHVALVGIGDVQNTPVGRKRNAVRPAGWLGDYRHLTLRSDVIHAVEIQLARIGLVAESRIGEVDVAVFAHYDVVGRVQTLAFPLIGQHFDLALLVGAGHAPGEALAGVEPALRIESVAVGAVGWIAEYGVALAGDELQNLVAWDIAEQQIAFARPGRSFREAKSVRNLFNLNVGEYPGRQRGSVNSARIQRRHRLPLPTTPIGWRPT